MKEKPKLKYKSEEELSPLVKSLIGVIPQHDGDDFDYKKARMDYLTEKYGITRNPKDFHGNNIRIYMPHDFIKEYFQ